MPRHTWIYLPVTLFLLAVFSVTAVTQLIDFQQLRNLQKLASIEAANVTPGYVQGVTRERRSRRSSNYRYYAFVDYATPEVRLTLKAMIDKAQYERFSVGEQVSVIVHPDNPRIAVMKGARDSTGWGKRLLILFLIAGAIICIQLIISWLLAPKRYIQYDFSKRSNP